MSVSSLWSELDYTLRGKNKAKVYYETQRSAPSVEPRDQL